MKQTIYIMGSIEFLTGAVLLWIRNILPMVGEILCQASGNLHFQETFDTTSMGLSVPVLLMVIGIIQIAYVFLGKRKSGGKPENPVGAWLRGEEKEG